ncbi:MAG: hypothetical protein HY751_04705 [Nitrospinae bacterium]|nr:hypothetical protein [Nitrospinota bacterium]
MSVWLLAICGVSMFLVLLSWPSAWLSSAELIPFGIHVIWGVFACFIVMLMLFLTMFYFIVTGNAVTKLAMSEEGSSKFHYRSKRIKRRLFIWMLVSMGVIMAAPISGVSHYLLVIPKWEHTLAAVLALVFQVITTARIYHMMAENALIIKEAFKDIGAYERNHYRDYWGKLTEEDLKARGIRGGIRPLKKG